MSNEQHAQQQKGLTKFDLMKMSEGMYCVGEYRGIDERESNGKMYYKLKVLVGDNTKKFDIKPDQVIAINTLQKSAQVVVGYYEFTGKFGMNFVSTSLSTL